MADALKLLPQSNHPDLLIGFNKADDAGVFRINDRQALVQTLDFFPPIVDDPYHFGRIAAANALSDVYAMGGRPLTALNIVAFPTSDLPASYLTDILRGGTEKVEEAGAVIVGGHSIKDKELKYGVSVTGVVHPDKVISNSTAQPGDRLFLTKPLGTGLITTGIKREAVSDELINLVTETMAALNREASELMVRFGAHAATDITGYGLLGHAFEMADGSGVTITLEADRLPLLPQALELAEAGMIPAGANANRDFLNGKVHISDGIDKNLVHVMFDPQTSGGLLIAIDKERAEEFEKELKAQGGVGQMSGTVDAAGKHPLIVR